MSRDPVEVAVDVPPRDAKQCGLLSDREWLCLFPAAPPPPAPDATALDQPKTEDPAAELRAERPLTRAALVRGLAGFPAAKAFAAVQMAISPFAHRIPGPAGLALHGSIILATVATAVANSVAGTFGPAQMAAGAAGVILLPVSLLLMLLYVVATGTGISMFGLRGRNRSAQAPPDRDVGTHPLAIIVRWLELRETAMTEHSALLEHDATDAFCPCPDRACAGQLPNTAGWWRWGRLAFSFLSTAGCWFFIVYTGFITLGPVMWHVWYGIAANFACIIVMNGWFLIAPFIRIAGSIPADRLRLRLRRRAAALFLRGLLASYRGLSARDPVSESNDEAKAAIFTLHAALVAAWDRRAAATAVTLSYLAAVLIPIVLSAVINVSVAAGNDEIEAVARLYLRAEAELRSIVVRRGSPPGAAEAADALLSLSRVRESRVKLAGMYVDYTVMRTVLVTSFTVGLGIWTLLRSIGVAVTLDIACQT